VQWIFGQDGSIEVAVELSGIMLTKGINGRTCEVCVDAAGSLAAAREDRHGTLVAPHVVATNHQHFFNARLDLDVDGASNSVAEMNVHSVEPRPDNPYQNAFVMEKTSLTTEKAAQRDLSLADARVWEVFAPGKKNALGHDPGYLLEPGHTAVPYLAPGSPLRVRAPFLDHAVRVTRMRAEERYSGGEYPNQSLGGDGLRKWVEDDEALAASDLVLWYTFGVTHIPRPEDWPVMSVARTGFRLVPSGFFARNPALDVP
jgi:primary-amine oxidase